MQALILIVHVLAAISIIGLVLIQHGKGADAGAAFGSSGGGASGTMFGSTGALPFLIKLTGILAAIFFATSLILSYMANPHGKTAAPAAPVSVPTAPAVAQPPANSVPQTPGTH